jgi:hypothetical protein
MSTESVPPNFDNEFINRYRRQVHGGLTRNIRNIYLYNVRGYCLGRQVENAAKMELPPDEQFMRFIEDRAGVSKSEAPSFRESLWKEWSEGKQELLNSKLDHIFRVAADCYQLVQKALTVYPNDLRINLPDHEVKKEAAPELVPPPQRKGC